MTTRNAETNTLGFLTAVQHKQLGTFGGYLLLTRAGRPIEFHCTAPVKANRAQEILYGPTLQQYLHAEVIGPTLVEKGTQQPSVLLVDRSAMLGVREFVSVPTALVLRSSKDPGDDDAEAVSGGGQATDRDFSIGSNRLRCWPEKRDDQQLLIERLSNLSQFDLAEPFVRIRDAIKEAQQAKAAG